MHAHARRQPNKSEDNAAPVKASPAKKALPAKKAPPAKASPAGSLASNAWAVLACDGDGTPASLDDGSSEWGGRPQPGGAAAWCGGPAPELDRPWDAGQRQQRQRKEEEAWERQQQAGAVAAAYQAQEEEAAWEQQLQAGAAAAAHPAPPTLHRASGAASCRGELSAQAVDAMRRHKRQSELATMMARVGVRAWFARFAVFRASALTGWRAGENYIEFTKIYYFSKRAGEGPEAATLGLFLYLHLAPFQPKS